jgi:AcrR family transcriptional regulator
VLVNKARAQRRNPARTAEAILKAAEAEFAGKGLGGARIDGIARRAGTNKRMIYHYFGSKVALYLAVLERVYVALRGTEQTLDLEHLAPRDAIAALVRSNIDYRAQHPELISLINNENLHRARHLKKSKLVRKLHSPLIAAIARILRRGAAEGVFRAGVDPVQLYISIAALGYFYCSNNWTLSTIFGRDLMAPRALAARREHMVEMILGYLRPD